MLIRTVKLADIDNPVCTAPLAGGHIAPNTISGEGKTIVATDSRASLRVLLFSDYFEPLITGTVISTRLQMEGLIQSGHSVKLISTSFAPNKNLPHVEWLPSLRLPGRVAYTTPLPTLSKVDLICRNFQPDIIHIQHPFLSGILGLRAAEKWGIPKVYTFHTLLDEYVHYFPIPRPLALKLVHRLLLHICSSVNCVIAPSFAARDYLRSIGVSSRIETIPSGINISKFRTRRSDNKTITGNPPFTGQVLLYVGRCVKEKNLYFLLDEFTKVLSVVKSAKLVIVGDGSEKHNLITYSQKLGISQQVSFEGSVNYSNIQDYYHGADLFVFPSLSETQGIVLVEALAAGIPVVALQGPGQEDVIIDGVNGFLCTPSEFAYRIAELLINRSLYNSIRNRTHGNLQRFSVEQTSQRIISLYSELISSSNRQG